MPWVGTDMLEKLVDRLARPLKQLRKTGSLEYQRAGDAKRLIPPPCSIQDGDNFGVNRFDARGSFAAAVNDFDQWCSHDFQASLLI
jgi:hypothetical protein